MKKKNFEELIESVRQVGKIRRGEISPSRVFVFKPEAIKTLRARLNKSQSEFAAMLGVSVSTLQNWEQGRRKPDGSAKILLRIAAMKPDLLEMAIYSSTQ